MDYGRYKKLAIERRDSVLTVTLNRPERYNAIDDELHEELGDIFYDIAKDDETLVVVLTGAGTAFCAGGDLKAMAEHLRSHGAAGHYLNAATGKRVVNGMLDLEKPIIAKINGVAIGLGATLALFCDISYIADDTRIGDPHVAAGVVAGDGGAIIWPQLIGYNRAKEYLMTGDMIPAAEAAAMGLVNHAVPRDELDAAVDAMAHRLVAGPTDAIRWSKVATNIGLKQIANSALDASIAYEIVTMRSASHAEAIEAFASKRQPDFTGL
ncbi:enoyl-CoA hydratase/isomerase family protein [Microbacterium lacus]|uniref:enoyl-CoA hydratase/isomerase family protein n=1 Tax=Microbacterium lacus TaxID=415217 RepID=UPI00384C9AA8